MMEGVSGTLKSSLNCSFQTLIFCELYQERPHSAEAACPKCTWIVVEGSLEVKVPTVWADGKAQPGRSSDRERVREGESQKREGGVREKVEKSRNTVLFPMFCGSEGRKVGSLKRRVRSQLGKWEIKSCTPLRHKAEVKVKWCKMWQKLTASEQFWKLRCRKIACHCGRDAHFKPKKY